MTEQVLPQVALTGSTTGLDPVRAMEHALASYHHGVREELEKRVLAGPLEMTSDVLGAILMEVAAGHLRGFRIMAGVAFRLAAKNARASQHLPPASLTEAAHLSDEEAMNLGAYLAAQDANAVLEGYHVAVNSKIPAKEAARRAVRAFGLTAPQLRTSFSIKDDGVDSARPGAYTSKVAAFIERATRQRHLLLASDAISKAEADALQAGREHAQEKGEIPRTATKRWFTALDERTCPVCAPMDQVAVALDGLFELPDGNKVKHPPVHPRCRCTTEVDDGEEVSKAWEEKEHPRGGHGRFTNKVRVKEGPVVNEGFWHRLNHPEPTGPTVSAPNPFGIASPTVAGPQIAAPNIQGPTVAAGPQVASPQATRALAQAPQAIRRLNALHQIKVAANIEAVERHRPRPQMPPDVQPTPPQLIAFAPDAILGLTHYGTGGGKAQIDTPLHFVDGNDHLAVAGAINSAMWGMDRHLQEYPPTAEFVDLEQAHDSDLADAAKRLRATMLAATRKPKGDVQVEVSPEDAMQAWRYVLSPTGSSYKNHFQMEAVDEEGNTVAAVAVDAATVVAFTNPDAIHVPHAVIAPHGTWKSGSMAGSTDEVTPGGIERRVTGAFNFEHRQGVIVITPDLGVLPRATPEN